VEIFLFVHFPEGQGLLIVENARSYPDTPQSVGLLWASDKAVADTSYLDNKQHSLETDIHVSGGF
jgi:hypothetical protein